MTEPVVVAGGTIAALVAADELARDGREVELLLPRKGVGGGFMPIQKDGRRLERGIRVLELRYEGVGDPPPLSEYEPGEYGHRPFARLIEAWVRELAGDDRVVEVEAPQMVLDGRLAPEALLTSDISALGALLDPAEAGAIAAEARAAADARGDAGVLDPGVSEDLWRVSLESASVANHGSAFHARLIAPLCEKIRPEGASDVLAALRRKLWMPLFWPRTVWEACSGREVGFRPQRPFHTVRPGGTGELVHLLLARIEAAANVRIARHDGVTSVGAAADGRVRIELADGSDVHARRPILGLAPGELYAATGIEYAPARVRSALAWVEVRDDDVLTLPGFVHVIDRDLQVFRITPGERDDATGRRILCLELRHDAVEEDVPASARAALEGPGILRAGAPIDVLAFFAGPTFTAPTADSLERFEAAHGAYDALELDAVAIGGVGAFGADAFNEQLVQGLQAAHAA